MAVLPYGRPGVVSGAMLGLGRALGETIAVYLILSTVEPTFSLSIFSGGETFASKIANGAGRVQQPAVDRRLHRRRPGAVRADLRRQRGRPSDRQPPEGLRMSTHDRAAPSTAPTFAPGAAARARSRTTSRPRWSRWSFGIALVPLVWLLWTVVSKGYHVIVRTRLVDRSDQAGISVHDAAAAASSHAIIGTAEQVALCTVISVPIALLVGIYLVEYGRGAVRAGHDVHGRHPHRHPVDRRRAVHLRAVRHDAAAAPAPAGWCRSRW